MTGAVSFVVKIFTEASASVASIVVTALVNQLICSHALWYKPHGSATPWKEKGEGR